MKYHKNKSILISNILLILFCVYFQGCEKKYNEYVVAINNITSFQKEINNLDFIMVIPGEGCGGCISSATSYVLLNSEKFDNSLIIFTGVLDKKLLRNQVGSEFLNKENVLIDKNNYLMKQNLKSPYPYFFQINDSELINKTDFDEIAFESQYEKTL